MGNISNGDFPGMENINQEFLDNNVSNQGSIDRVFSGNNDASQQHVPNTGPIPGGNYLIGNQGGGRVILIFFLYMEAMVMAVIPIQPILLQTQTGAQQTETDLICILEMLV